MGRSWAVGFRELAAESKGAAVPTLALDQRLSLGQGGDALRIEALVVPLNEPTRGSPIPRSRP